MKERASLIDDLKRRLQALISIDLAMFDGDAQAEIELATAEEMFPVQLTWLLVEVTRQYDVTSELMKLAMPSITQFQQTNARNFELSIHSEPIPETDWELTITDGFDGLVVRLMNYATGEVFFVTEAMPLQFAPTRAACHRSSRHVEESTPTTERYYDTLVSTGDCVSACSLLAEIGLLEPDLDGYAPTDELASHLSWFRTLGTLWSLANRHPHLAGMIGDWEQVTTSRLSAQSSNLTARRFLAEGYWTLLKSYVESKETLERLAPESGGRSSCIDGTLQSARSHRMLPFFGCVQARAENSTVSNGQPTASA